MNGSLVGAPKGSDVKAEDLTCGGTVGLGGAGRGGGCLLFFGGNAGLGLEGRPGGPVGLVGAWRTAKGSQPKGSFSSWNNR